jgi:hypothetical protein
MRHSINEPIRRVLQEMKEDRERDNCEICGGEKGGVPGNENIVDGVRMCDYCHATLLQQAGKLEEIQGLVREKKIEFAPQDRVEALDAYIDKFLQAIEIPQAWVSDESCVGDFPLEEEDMAELEATLGVEVKLRDYVVDVAERMKALENDTMVVVL